MSETKEPRALADLARALIYVDTPTGWVVGVDGKHIYINHEGAQLNLPLAALWQAPPRPDADAFADAVDAYGFANYDHGHLSAQGSDHAQRAKQRVIDTYAALLAFGPSDAVRIKEVTEAAREVVDRADADVLFGYDLTDEELRLKSALAALNGGAHE